MENPGNQEGLIHELKSLISSVELDDLAFLLHKKKPLRVLIYGTQGVRRVTQIITELWFDAGLISHQHVSRRVGRDQLIGDYCGWSKRKTLAVMEDCENGVIVIENLDQIWTGYGDYKGNEVIHTLIQYMRVNIESIESGINPDDYNIIFTCFKSNGCDPLFEVAPGFRRFITLTIDLNRK